MFGLPRGARLQYNRLGTCETYIMFKLSAFDVEKLCCVEKFE